MYRKGDLIKATWRDPTGTINSPQSDAGLSVCVTIGTVLRRKGPELVLWTSMYSDGTCDTTTLHIGAIDKAVVLVPRETLKRYKATVTHS